VSPVTLAAVSKPMYITNTYATPTPARQMATVKLAHGPSTHSLSLPTYAAYQVSGRGVVPTAVAAPVPTAVVPVSPHMAARSTTSTLTGTNTNTYILFMLIYSNWFARTVP